MFIAQVLVGPSKQLKQIIQTEHNIVENPNWPEANELAIYKHGQGFELGTAEKQIQVVVRAGLEPWAAGLRVRPADHSTTLPYVSIIYYLSYFELGYFEFPAISNSSFFPYTLNQQRYFELGSQKQSTRRNSQATNEE